MSKIPKIWPFDNTQVWGAPSNGPAVAQDVDWPAAPVAAPVVVAAAAPVVETAPVMKDQQTQKVFKSLVRYRVMSSCCHFHVDNNRI